MPVLPHYYGPDDNTQVSPSYLNNGYNYQPTHQSYNQPNYAGQFEDIPSPTSHIPKIPPIVPEHRRLNADSHSSSSDEASNPIKVVRPSIAPPSPPSRQNTHSTNNTSISKPKLPPKPPTHKKPNLDKDEDNAQPSKVSVKDMAAKLNAKLSNV
ncbi:hypothetical protein M3Y97_00898200 [Aphelenchoides bicaudatus]|nr:hypothetical protein M3Y97_00898200 [Aphelenchoides bicaudatus]